MKQGKGGMAFRGAPSASDIRKGGWIDRRVPASIRPYLRLARVDRPVGIWLLMLPCWWGVALAERGAVAPSLLLLFAAGAVVMRGAGCTFNDIVDREYDARVARTATRPIPAGEVTVPQAVAFLLLQMLIGLCVLLTFNDFAILVGLAAVPLIFIYPFMKRITYWPQAFLGLAFNWGALIGWAAVRGQLDPPALALYAAGVFWTLGYDTIYAHQDKEDDALIGVKSTARRLGAATRPWLFAFYGAALALLALAGALVDLAWPFYLGLAAAGAQLAWQAGMVDIDDAADCLAKFKSNSLFGAMIFAAIVAGQLAG